MKGTMIDLKGINFENLSVRLGSIIGRVLHFHKEEHNEKTLNVDLSTREIAGTHIDQVQIAQQINITLPEGVSSSDQSKLLRAALGGGDNSSDEAPISVLAEGDAVLPAHTTNSPAEDFLTKHREEYAQDETLLLERGGLLYIYKGREGISFAQDDLVFLVQSSLKNDFPAWFWLFNYRERFGNVVPLLQRAYKHASVKVRHGVIDSLNGFTETADEVCTLMETEPSPEVIGYAASAFLAKDETDAAQRVIANALTRRIIPRLTNEVREKIFDLKLDLGVAEKRVLHNEIKNGWPSDRLRALTVLNLSAEEADLLPLEEILVKNTFTDVTNLVLTCIARIGKTNKADYIEKEMEDSRWQESFTAHLKVLVAIRYKAIFPRLLGWLSDSYQVSRRFWFYDSKGKDLDNTLQKAASDLLDKDTYEELVQYILKKYSPDRNGNIMSWRHFRTLHNQKNNPEIMALLKDERRLKEFEPWEQVVEELEFVEKMSQENAQQAIASITPDKSKQAYLVLRKLYESISPGDALEQVAPVIESFRKNLSDRLVAIASGSHSDEIKGLAKNELEKFLGENRMFYRLDRAKKKNSRYETEGGADEEFDTLNEDIGNFSVMEKEYLAHVFKSKSPEATALLLNSVGRPYESIYDSVTTESGDLDILAEALTKTAHENENSLINLKAVEALQHIKKGDTSTLHALVLTILIEARDNVKASRGMTKESDDWFVSEITYLWALNALIEFAEPSDFDLVREATNREKPLLKNYHRYSYFFSYEVMEELLGLSETLEDEKEKSSALSALNTLDYNWTKKILNVEN